MRVFCYTLILGLVSLLFLQGSRTTLTMVFTTLLIAIAADVASQFDDVYLSYYTNLTIDNVLAAAQGVQSHVRTCG